MINRNQKRTNEKKINKLKCKSPFLSENVIIHE